MKTSQEPDWLTSFYATLLTGSSVFVPHYRLADQFLCHTIDWLISFYATVKLAHQFLCHNVNR